MEWASKFVEKAIDVVLDLTIRHVGYIIYYRENVSELNGLVEDLRLERERVEHGVDEAEKNLGITEGDVRKWIQEVDKTRTETEGFLNDEGDTMPECSSGLLPYLRNRHRLGRKAKKMAAYVKLLIKEHKFDRVSYQQHPTSNDAALYNAGYEDFGSRKHTMDEIMKNLEDSTVKMIGVHGPGGVGKSTLIKEIAKEARDKKLFNVVVVADVTHNPNLRTIQEEIAYELGLRLEAEGETVRADLLRRRLKIEKENTLIILDDLWDKIDLNKIGIPFDDDNDDDLSHMTVKDMKDRRDLNTTKDMKEKDFKMVRKEKSFGDYKGCKILLTSRDKNVLSDKMDVKSIFCVRELNDKESLMLFQKMVGMADEIVNSTKEKEEKKQEIVKKYCAGLPMAIVVVGRALKDKSESVWEATLEKLKKEELGGVQKSMEISVKMSYDHLESEELKSIFLLCAQMGHQQLIMDLVNYCFGLGILKGVYTLREAQDRIYTSIQKLKDSSLMLDGSSIDRFNMHDMVRDAALSIAHKEQNVFALRNGILDDWPDKDELERCTAISIRSCDIIDELPKVINCPQLKFLQIDSDDPSLKIPEIFFEGMEKLRVLILTGFHLPCLPSSIKCLLNLRMLCLERCTLIVDNLSIIGELKKLRILSFSGSQIENLPAELGCLDKLQLFDISHCSIKNVVPPNFISRLTCLEELYIRKSLIKMEAKSQKSFLSQLKHLHQLRVVDLCIAGAAVLPRDLFLDRLNDYKIVIGDFKMHSVGDFRMPNKYEALRSLALQLTDGTHDIHSQKGIKLLFKGVENLLLGELNGVQNAVCELNMDGFPDLKHLSIVNNIGIEYIINSMDLSHPQNAFPNLESLCLYKLWNIKTLCYTPVTDASFTKLKIIKVKMCTQLKNLFSIYMVKFLTSLETVDVSKCDSLREIVFKEGQAYSSDKVEFHKLRSLTLESLPSFSSFYTNVEMPSVEGQAANGDHMEITIAEDDYNVMAPLSLFSEQVEISNLESLELSSINNHKIWSDQPPSSSYFQNLTKLTVKDCHNLRYLCSLSVASGLKKLKGLFISKCSNMERIFSTEGNSVEKRNSVEKVCVFPKLEEICLTELNMLTDIWQAEVGADSFSSLISVQIERCEKLDKIFPSHMTGWFRSLESLKVFDCRSVELIFEIKDTQKKDASRSVTDTKLQVIHVQGHSNLRQIWGTDPKGILSFKNLRSIQVGNCRKLRYVLPGSVAKDLKSLESISVGGCREMEEIVASEDGPETPLKFPEVTCMQLSQLSINRFYKGRHIECPKLKELAVVYCEKLETFATETTSEERKPIFYAEKVISNLEIMQIDSKEALWLQSNLGMYLMHRLKGLTLYSLSSIEYLYWLLHRMPNLERLILLYDKKIKELVPRRIIVPQERLGTVLQLKKLILGSSAIKDLGLERDPVLQRLERLTLHGCRSLINLAPSSVSLTHLTYLEVNYCDRLTNLMASSTAKSMVQLATMKVIGCSKLKEIVTNEGNEEGGVIEVVFSKLISIELVRLRKLTSFCSYKNCEFKFPSLERLIVRECPAMETFTESFTTAAPKLQNTLIAVEGEEEEKAYWEGELNATIQKVSKDKVFFKYLNLSDYPEFLERVWHRNALVHENMFHNLKTLKISECSDLVHAIPSHLLPCLGNLEELEVRYCSEVQVIFNINDDTRLTKALGTFRLKKLTLDDLPKLEHVWDKDPEGIFGLQLLQETSVDECGTLKSLFPASVANDLTRLEVLSVTRCAELVEIFSKDEIAAEGGATKEFVFPCLTSLDLTELPALKYFYPGLHKLEWPLLKELRVNHCNIMTLKLQEDHAEEQALIQIDQKVIQIPCLKILSFGIGDTMVIWNQESWALQFDELQRFQEEPGSVLYRFIVMLSKIEKLELRKGSLEELFSVERPNADYTRVILHLKELKLIDLDNLTSIGLEHSWLHPIPENLQILKIEYCARLENLVPRTVSFSNLTYLQVLKCKRLLYLFTSSTAKSLCLLKEMKIEGCESVEEIVSTEGDESNEDEKMIFGQLHTLFLKGLPKLRCFYPGNLALCFPSLEKVFVIRCKWMKTFCPVNKIDPTKFSSGVIFTSTEDDSSAYDETPDSSADDETPVQRWEGDLNSTLRKRFEEEVVYIEHLHRYDYPEFLERVWHRNALMHENMFHNLKTLKISECSDPVHVIPSHLLPCFRNLEELEVRDCNEVQVIFNINDTRVTKALGTFRLKKLTLKFLPKLEHVWDKDPEGIFGLQLLQEISVDECGTLKSLFPASVANDLTRLEVLSVTCCAELVEIFSKDEIATEGGATKEFVFPCLTSLDLTELPALKYFYPGLHKLECPLLQKISLNGLAEEQALIQIEKVIQIPCLLSFGIGDTMVIWNQESWALQFDELQRFQEEPGSVLYRFIVMLSKIEKLELRKGSLEELFSVEKPNADYTRVLLHLKELKLIDLDNLTSIGLEHSWLHPIPENLQILKIEQCACLINLVPHTVSFSNLTDLQVLGCKRLLYLFTSSTAKSLCQLKEMKIEGCESVEEIVSTEGDESNEDEKMIFGQLHTLFLKGLPKLRCFYPGNLALCFPSLEKVFVIRCKWMKTFCPVNKIDPTKFSSGVIFTEDATPRWEGNLNSTLRKRFEEEVVDIEHVDSYDYPEFFERVWHRSAFLHENENMFHNLKTLKISYCSDLVHVIPSHLLPCFGNLEELEVSHCWAVQVILNINDMRVSKALATFRLKKLTLKFLPKLEHVWDKDLEGIFCLQLLHEISVVKCQTLKSLFPASVAKDLTRLEVLRVRNCRELVEIFSKDEIAAEEGATKEFVFPCLTSLDLTKLPALKYFYPGLHKLEWPLLKELRGYQCNIMTPKLREDHAEEQALIQIDQKKSLVEDESQATFSPIGRQDILITAIGTPEHLGCVRIAGRGVGFKKFFGGTSRCQSKQLDMDTMRHLIMQVVSQMFEAYKSQLKSEMEAQQSQKLVPSPKATTRVSTKGSCSPESEEEEDPKGYILKYIGHLAFDLPDGHVGITLEHDDLPVFYIFAKDLTDLSLGGEFWLASQHLQLWSTYLYRICIQNNTSDVYGFLDPTLMIVKSNPKESNASVQTYIQNTLIHQDNDVYLGPYIHNKHWQLIVICPKHNLIVWVCSLHLKPNLQIERVLEGAMEKYNSEKGNGEGMKPRWNILMGPYQNNSWACGYYVMKTMLSIVTMSITSGWDLLFDGRGTQPYSAEEIVELRETWARFFVTKIKDQNLNLEPPRR